MSNPDDLPVWIDCPYRGQVPSAYEIRRGAGRVCLVGKARDGSRVSADLDDRSVNSSTMTSAYQTLAGAIFDRDYPGDYMRLVRARINGTLTEDDKRLLDYQKELGCV